MIIPSETCQYLQAELPEISSELSKEKNLFCTMRALSDFSCKTVRDRDYQRLRRCLRAAAGLYENGSMAVRNAVENVFVYSFSRMMTIARGTGADLRSLIPPTLLALYMNQVLHHGY